MAKLVGPQHVGLGLDYVFDMASFENFVSKMPERYDPNSGYSDMKQVELDHLPCITQELMHRGYTEKEIRGILGENWLRVCGQVWK